MIREVAIKLREKPASKSEIKYFPFMISDIESVPRNTKNKLSSSETDRRNQKSRYGEKLFSIAGKSKSPFPVRKGDWYEL